MDIYHIFVLFSINKSEKKENYFFKSSIFSDSRCRKYWLMVREIALGVNFAHMFGQVALAIGWMVAEWTTIRLVTRVYDSMSLKQSQCFKWFVTNLTWVYRFIVYSILVCYQPALDSKHWTTFFTPLVKKIFHEK